MYVSLVRPCTRICARLRSILLTIRARDDFVRKTCFRFVKCIRFEMKSDALKSMILQFLSLARLPIPPPWQETFRF